MSDPYEMVMQRAAFVLHVAYAVPMIAMAARRAVIVGIGKRGLTFKHVHGVVEHHRHDAGELGEQKQPEQPWAQGREAAYRLQRSQAGAS